MLRHAFSLFVSLFIAFPIFAQSPSDYERSRYSPASFYNYAEPGDVTMLVNVWGTVRYPGLYEIPQGTTLARLLSLAGGPIVSVRESRQKRTIQIRVFRPEGSTRDLLLETQMENEVIVADEDPHLTEGDVVTVETVVRRKFDWRDVFPIVAAVGTVAIAVERLVSAR